MKYNFDGKKDKKKNYFEIQLLWEIFKKLYIGFILVIL